jgi:hypothetical protein
MVTRSLRSRVRGAVLALGASAGTESGRFHGRARAHEDPRAGGAAPHGASAGVAIAPWTGAGRHPGHPIDPPRRRSRRGGVKLGCFAAMIVLGIGGWAGAYVGEAYWKYYQFADAFKQEAKFAGHYTDRQIKQHLRSMADSLVLPDDAYEIVVERGRHHIVIDSQYYAHVNLGVMTRDFFFNPHAEADF